MNFWMVLLTFIFMASIMGWTMAPLFMNGILWICEWREGNDLNWGREIAFSLYVPFCWMFALIEIMLLYFT